MKKLLFILSIIFLIAGCNNDQFNSIKPNETPSIDGELIEWQGALITPQNESFGFGVMNDDSNLYLSMSTYDKQIIMKILNGLTVWIDKDGKKNESFGINCPVKQDMMGMRDMMGMQGKMEQRGMHEMEEDREEQQEMMIQQRLTQQDGIIIINNDGETLVAMDNGENGIQLEMLYNKGILVYEVKVPFNEFGLSEIDKISVGFETSEIEKPEMGGMRGGGSGMSGGGKPSGGMSGGGMGGGNRGGGMGGGRPGGQTGGIQDMMNPIEVWIKVNLVN